MPLYPGVAGTNTIPAQTPASLRAGEQIYLVGTAPSGQVPPPNDSNVVGESFVTGNASVAFTMLGPSSASYAPSVSIQIQFSGAPGIFEIDIQEADTDADNFYILPTGSTAYKITSVNATTFTAFADLIPTGGRFMRIKVVSLANAVTLICKACPLT
jgi:hypothetical protein